ncbi:MAG: hypothetical protein AAFX99_20050 [Myxococcota bacterium]
MKTTATMLMVAAALLMWTGCSDEDSSSDSGSGADTGMATGSGTSNSDVTDTGTTGGGGITEDTSTNGSDTNTTTDTGSETTDTTVTPEDTNMPPEDTDMPPEDTDMPPEDTNMPPEDTDMPPEDTDMPPEDTDMPPEDTDMPEDVEEDLPPEELVFREIDGLVVFEAEHYAEQIRNEWTNWYEVSVENPEPDVTCRTNVSCRGNAPDCNQYDECDHDDIDPADASGGTYLEALPDRRRDDSEPGTGGQIGVVNDPDRAPTLIYNITITTPGRYYVWVHARGRGPAANGLHVGLDGTWPRNDLIDPSTMRLQFRNGWRWTQTRRGGQQHTGVSGTDEISERDANVWLQIDEPGPHTIELGMREDGLEIDKVVLARDPDYEPTNTDDMIGPPETR